MAKKKYKYQVVVHTYYWDYKNHEEDESTKVVFNAHNKPEAEWWAAMHRDFYEYDYSTPFEFYNYCELLIVKVGR